MNKSNKEIIVGYITEQYYYNKNFNSVIFLNTLVTA